MIDLPPIRPRHDHDDNDYDEDDNVDDGDDDDDREGDHENDDDDNIIDDKAEMRLTMVAMAMVNYTDNEYRSHHDSQGDSDDGGDARGLHMSAQRTERRRVSRAADIRGKARGRGQG